MSTPLPAIEINGSVSDSYGSSSNNFQASIATDWSQLIAPGGNVFQASGARIFDMDAGTIASASTAQIGRVVNGVKTTKAMVDHNQLLLNAIGAYCRNNGISIHVEATLTSTKAQDWTQQWLQPALLAGLPITAVESDDEISSSVADTPANYAALANNEAAIVAQITKSYPTVKIGDWQGGATSAAITDWWAAYDKAAEAANLPRISYVIADTSWNAPWVTATSAWQAWLVNLSQLFQTNHMQLTVLVSLIPSFL
jgi:hypothetical protein